MFRKPFKMLPVILSIIIITIPCVVHGATRVNSFCAAGGCTTRTVYNSKYCSEHVCKKNGCVDRGNYQGYCYKHRYKNTQKNKEPDSDSSKCMVNGCNMHRGRGYDYCTLHTCSKIGCHNQRISGSTYCREHKEQKK